MSHAGPPMTDLLKTYSQRFWRWLTREQHKALLRHLQGQIKKQFTQHPGEGGETYTQHLWFTLRMTTRILYCAVTLLIHGIFPFLLKRTTSRQMEIMYRILRTRLPERREGSDSGF